MTGPDHRPAGVHGPDRLGEAVATFAIGRRSRVCRLEKFQLCDSIRNHPELPPDPASVDLTRLPFAFSCRPHNPARQRLRSARPTAAWASNMCRRQSG